jgi:hypothetical protein
MSLISYDENGNEIRRHSETPPEAPQQTIPLPDWGGVGALSAPEIGPNFGEREVPGIPEGAEPPPQPNPTVSIKDINGNTSKDDHRVRIMVPPKYITGLNNSSRNEIKNNGGILFPYTPTISYEAKAEYAEMKPLHSNFVTNFYQRSNVGSISIAGKFSVENADEAGIYLATSHLLMSLTKMRFGKDSDSGAPPPVCRLFANGVGMLYNVPVAISSYRIELPDSVDYFTIVDPEFGKTSVPVISTISITCIPMYSRAEMQGFSVTGYNAGEFMRQGFI